MTIIFLLLFATALVQPSLKITEAKLLHPSKWLVQQAADSTGFGVHLLSWWLETAEQKPDLHQLHLLF